MTKKKKARKVEIVFDPKSRKEFLTGFRKRKNERKKRAKDEMEALLKIERQRIRLEVKDSVKHLKKSYEPIPEVQHLIEDKDEYENDDVNVKIVEISTDLAAPNPASNDAASDQDDASEDEDSKSKEEIPGMSTTPSRPVKSQPQSKLQKMQHKITSKKDLNRIANQTAAKKIKRSKVFKTKSKLDKVADRKKASKAKRIREKEQAKKERRGFKSKHKKGRRK